MKKIYKTFLIAHFVFLIAQVGVAQIIHVPADQPTIQAGINAASDGDARLAARSIAGSNLVKAAVFGRDANWGRVICAAGYSGAVFDPEKVDIFLGDVQVARDGGSLEFSEEKALEALSKSTVAFTLDFKSGGCCATAWGCDLSYDYVKINADYRT